MQAAKWLKCPACSEEWNKLRSCSFINAQGKDDADTLCLSCAESVVALPYVEDRYPIPGVTVEMKWMDNPSFQHSLGGKTETHWLKGKRYATVLYGQFTFVVISKETSPYINFKGSDGKLRYADNIFAAWSMIRHILTKGNRADLSDHFSDV